MISRDHTRGLQVLAGFTLLLLACNLHLFAGTVPSALIYKPQMVALGEWWRLITHPFVHVSWYHLAMDNAAVALLWCLMPLQSLGRKTVVAACSGAGCLVAVAFLSADVELHGFCGLSGVAHGMSICLGLLWLRSGASRETTGTKGNWRPVVLGGLLVLVSVTKVLLEIVSGTVILAAGHLGELGIPVVESHLGGLVGGLVAYLVVTVGKETS